MDEFEKDMDFEPKKTDKETTKSKLPTKKRKGRKFKKIKLRKFAKYGLILLLLGVGLIIYNMVGCNKQEIESIYTFESDSNYQISEFDGKALAVSYDGAKIIKLDGTESAALDYNMANPHMNVTGNMILLYDKDSNKLAVYDGKNKKYSYECDSKIKSAKVNKNGYTVLISDETGYNSRVTVIDAEGKAEYMWKIGNEYIVDVDISPDNKKLVAATITTNTGVIVENIIFVDISKAAETGRAKTEGVMPLQVEFADNGNAIVVSDNRLCGYNSKAEKSWEAGFGNSLLDTFAIDEEGNTVVSLRGIKNNSVVRAYTKGGKNSGEYITETKAVHVDLNNKHVAVCEKNKISFVNYSGGEVSSMEVKKEVKDISVISNDKVILLCNDGIQLYRM